MVVAVLAVVVVAKVVVVILLVIGKKHAFKNMITSLFDTSCFWEHQIKFNILLFPLIRLVQDGHVGKRRPLSNQQVAQIL